MTNLKDSVAIVTGGASGIGLAVCHCLAGFGARVMVADLRDNAVEAACQKLTAEGHREVAGFACDVRVADACDQLVAATRERFGTVDTLVHCAGILRPPGSTPRPLHQLDEEEYVAVVDTNLKGTFLMNRAVLRVMVAQRKGQIVNVSSTSGRKGLPLDSVYSASKAGVIALSQSIAEEVRPFGVRVQVLLPDAVDTPLWEQNGPIKNPPPGSMPPQRVADCIAFCLSLPMDVMCENLVIMPFRSRAAKRAAGTPDANSLTAS